VTKDDLETVLKVQHDSRLQRISGWRLGELLIERGLVTQAQIAPLVAEQYELAYLELEEEDIDLAVVTLLPADLVDRYTALPIERLADGSLLVAVADPATVLFSDELRRALEMSPRFVVVAPDAMHAAIAYVRANVPAVETTRSWSPVEASVVHQASDRSTEEGEGGPVGLTGNGLRRQDPNWPFLGMLLVRDGLVSEEQLERALAQQRLSSSKRLGEILVERGSVSRRDIARVLAEQYELPFVDVVESELDPAISALLPLDVARRYSALPIGFQPDGTLRLAVADPTKALDLDEITAVLGARLSFVVADPDTIESVLTRMRWPQTVEPVEAAGDPVGTDPGQEAVEPTVVDEPVLELVEVVEAEPEKQWAELAREEPEPQVAVVEEDAPASTAVEEATTSAVADEGVVELQAVAESELAVEVEADGLGWVETGGLDWVEPGEPTALVAATPDESTWDEPDESTWDEPDESTWGESDESVWDEPEGAVWDESREAAEADDADDAEEAEEIGAEETEQDMVTQLLDRAASLAASAIHFSPQEIGYVIRARVDGVLRELEVVSGDAQHALSRELEHVSPAADGDWDVTELPTRYGRALTLVRRPAAAAPALDELALSVEGRELLSSALRRTSGLVLVVAPADNGTAVTFHAALCEVVSPETAVLTVEAPDAERIPGVDQILVDERSGLTFATGLRRVLRADPDTIGVGELVDRETSQLAVSASTSSLVVAIVRAQGAVDALARLVTKGVDRELLSETLAVVVAQRLVRTLCTHCRESYYASAEDLAALDRPEDEGGRRLLGRGKGCAACGGTGLSGRVSLYEVLSPGEELRALLTHAAPSTELESAAARAGLRTLRDEGIRLCLDGVTTVAELRRALGPDVV